MLFPTLDFALFFIAVFAVSWLLVRWRAPRHWFLIAASYFFYGYWDWRFCGLLLFASLTAWLAGLALDKTADPLRRKWITGLACALLLAVLGFFKYFGFFTESLRPILESVGFGRDMLLMQIVLPVGISFFTFQAISYVVDVHRGEVRARRSPGDLLLYVSFFPQLVAGPIVRASHFLPQLDRPPLATRRMMIFGLVISLFGLVKKMVIANYLAADLVDKVFFDPSAFSSLELLVAVYGYAVQIYCDFSGYSDMAIGTAALLGYRFRPNFRQPYRSASLREFWRRWHISLSQWLRDYLYKPLGGSRHGTLNTYRNLILTMLLGGLWHGAAWTFVAWGLLHGVGLALERAVSRGREAASGAFTHALSVIFTFHVVCTGWILFRAADFATAADYLAGLAQLSASGDAITGFSLLLIASSLAMQFAPEKLPFGITGVLSRRPLWLTAIVFALWLLVADWVAPPGTAPFIYFQF